MTWERCPRSAGGSCGGRRTRAGPGSACARRGGGNGHPLRPPPVGFQRLEALATTHLVLPGGTGSRFLRVVCSGDVGSLLSSDQVPAAGTAPPGYLSGGRHLDLSEPVVAGRPGVPARAGERRKLTPGLTVEGDNVRRLIVTAEFRQLAQMPAAAKRLADIDTQSAMQMTLAPDRLTGRFPERPSASPRRLSRSHAPGGVRPRFGPCRLRPAR